MRTTTDSGKPTEAGMRLLKKLTPALESQAKACATNWGQEDAANVARALGCAKTFSAASGRPVIRVGMLLLMGSLLLAQGPPTNVSVTPSSGSGPSQTFSFAASSPGGYQYINIV